MRLIAVRFRLGAGAIVTAALLMAGAAGAGPAGAATQNVHINCAESSLCPEVGNYAEVFGANTTWDMTSPPRCSIRTSRVRQPHALQVHPAEDPSQSTPTHQVLQLPVGRGDLVRHGPVRHPVLSRAGPELPAGQRPEHRRSGRLPQPSGHRVHRASVLSAGMGPVAGVRRRVGAARATRPSGAPR